MPMLLKSLKIERKEWGDDKGKLFGVVAFDCESAAVSFVLSPEQVDQIFMVAADAIEAQAREAAKSLTCVTIEHRNALEAARIMLAAGGIDNG